MIRYINADALRDELHKHENYKGGLSYEWQTIIARFPAADVRENVRGEWILISKETQRIKYYACTKCGRHVEVNSELPAYIYYPFCHCGAYMRGEE